MSDKHLAQTYQILVVCDWLTARGHKWINIGGGENDRKSGTSPNLKSSFEEKAKQPNLLDKKEFNYRAFYTIRPKLDNNVNQ
jgi:hypothetical protein